MEETHVHAINGYLIETLGSGKEVDMDLVLLASRERLFDTPDTCN